MLFDSAPTAVYPQSTLVSLVKPNAIIFLLSLTLAAPSVGLAMLDENDNGLSDVWEAAFGEGHPPDADEDGDGFRNRDEAIAGTDPMDPESSPMLRAVERMGETSVSQRWPTAGGVHYQPLASADLATWAPIGEKLIGTGEMADVRVDVGSAFSSGGVRRRKWMDLTGGLDQFRPFAREGGVVPAVDDHITELRISQSDPDEEAYGQYISGWIVPPVSGDYTFWIAGDDESQLWLSPNEDPAGVVRIARIPNWSNELEFTKNASQQSAAIPLVAGRAYFFEVFQREYGGGDHVAVAWTKPGDEPDSREIISGSALSSTGESLADLMAQGRAFFRLEVSDADRDGDGLTDYEEAVLGLDPEDSTTKPRVSDKPAARSRVASPSVLTLGVAVDRAYENGGGSGEPTAARFRIFRSGGIKPLVVNFSLSGSATRGEDYVDPGTTATLTVGAGSEVVSVLPLSDEVIELPEDVTLTLLPGEGYTLGAPSSASVAIDDAVDVLYVAQLRAPVSGGSGGSGIASVRRAGNALGSRVVLSFSGLASVQTAAEIFHSSTGFGGPTVLSLPLNQVGGVDWDFAPTAGFSSAELVAALDGGELWVRLRTTGVPEGEIVGQLRTTPAFETMPPPVTPPSAVASASSDAEAARFLAQASFGATDASVAAVRAGTFGQWIDAQMAVPATHHLDYVTVRRAEFEARDGNDGFQRPREEAFWQAALTAPDQLRQRMAFALSQIMVISQIGSLDGAHIGTTMFYDQLVDGAFGNFRDLLETVTLSPMMGQYLSMIRNRKPDPETGSEPDENYAREVMQLFTIGLTNLHTDGSIRLSTDGVPIPTYTQDDIVGLAHVFTGWGPHYDDDDPPLWNNGNVADRNGWFLYGRDEERPMTFYPEFGDQQDRTIVGGTNVAGTASGPDRMQTALDTLFNHPNVGPFIARHLIQKFVTSNPSPGYIHRVARVFNADSGGVRGNLGETLRAVLLDPEARNGAERTSISFGKGAEPVLRFARLLRATGALPPRRDEGDGRYFLDLRYNLPEQSVLQSPSVFNFFLPGYSAPGPVSETGLVSPEYQILTDTSVINQANLMAGYLSYGLYTPERDLEGDNLFIPVDWTKMVGILNNPDRTIAEAQGDLVDYLDDRLLFGAMSLDLRAAILSAFAAMPSWIGQDYDGQRRRAETAVYLVMTSPEGFVQR